MSKLRRLANALVVGEQTSADAERHLEPERRRIVTWLDDEPTIGSNFAVDVREGAELGSGWGALHRRGHPVGGARHLRHRHPTEPTVARGIHRDLSRWPARRPRPDGKEGGAMTEPERGLGWVKSRRAEVGGTSPRDGVGPLGCAMCPPNLTRRNTCRLHERSCSGKGDTCHAAEHDEEDRSCSTSGYRLLPARFS